VACFSCVISPLWDSSHAETRERATFAKGSMSNKDRMELCDFCKAGQLIERTQLIAFHQWTDKGYIFCRATVLIGVCDKCGSRNWDDIAEATIDEAVRQAYEKLR